MTPEQQLQARPSFEQATVGYLQMLTEMRAALQAIAPNLRWVHPAPNIVGSAGCEEPFSQIAGTETITYGSNATGRIPEAQWPRALQQLMAIAATYHFTAAQTLTVPASPTPGATAPHIVYLHDPWGGNFTVQTEVNTVLGVDSPCLRHESGRGGAPTTS